MWQRQGEKHPGWEQHISFAVCECRPAEPQTLWCWGDIHVTLGKQHKQNNWNGWEADGWHPNFFLGLTFDACKWESQWSAKFLPLVLTFVSHFLPFFLFDIYWTRHWQRHACCMVQESLGYLMVELKSPLPVHFRWVGMFLSAIQLEINAPYTFWWQFLLSVAPLILMRLRPDCRAKHWAWQYGKVRVWGTWKRWASEINTLLGCLVSRYLQGIFPEK